MRSKLCYEVQAQNGSCANVGVLKVRPSKGTGRMVVAKHSTVVKDRRDKQCARYRFQVNTAGSRTCIIAAAISREAARDGAYRGVHKADIP